MKPYVRPDKPAMRDRFIKRARNSWSFKIELGPDPITGKRRQKWVTVKGSKARAEQEYARLIHGVHTGAYVEPQKLTVGAFLDQWLVTYAESHVAGKTLERYRGIVNLHLKPSLGSLPLQKLTPLHIQNHYARAMKDGARKDGRKGGLSAQTVLHHHRVLSEALNMAVKWQLLVRNPADAAEPPEVRPKEVEVIDQAQTAWLMCLAEGTRLYIPILLAVAAGLRRGEILALRWRDVDFAAGVLRISRAVEETKTETRIKETKGKRSRSVAMPSLLSDALRAHRQEQDAVRAMFGADYQDGDLVCPQPDGQLWKPSAFTSAYRDLLRRRKLNGPNFHALRHSHASHLLKDGVDLKLVSERLGHSRASFTLDQYIHLLPGRDQEAAARVDAALRKAIQETQKARLM